MTGQRRRLVAYLLVVAALAAGVWRMESTVDRLDSLVRDNTAQRCVDEWADDAEDRRLSPLVGRALVEYAQGTADPADIRRFETIIAGLIDEEIVPPECDLAAAQARLNK